MLTISQTGSKYSHNNKTNQSQEFLRFRCRRHRCLCHVESWCLRCERRLSTLLWLPDVAETTNSQHYYGCLALLIAAITVNIAMIASRCWNNKHTSSGQNCSNVPKSHTSQAGMSRHWTGKFMTLSALFYHINGQLTSGLNPIMSITFRICCHDCLHRSLVSWSWYTSVPSTGVIILQHGPQKNNI